MKNQNWESGYWDAKAQYENGCTIHELRIQFSGMDLLDEDDLDYAQGAWAYIHECESAGYE